jgi:hypothetical protein
MKGEMMKPFRKMSAASMVATLALALGVVAPNVAQANHPVLVEGEADFDGDGMVGLAEDNDGDVVFGTITRALGAAPAIGQNGIVMVVTSGRFVEVVNLTGNVTLEGAPGVSVDVEAFLVPADPRLAQFPAAQAMPNMLQGAPGIVIDAPANRFVTVRNVTTSNWTSGVIVRNNSRALLDNVKAQNNINFGIQVSGNARAAIFDSKITATGFRLNGATGDFPTNMMPAPGVGVRFADQSRGNISGTTMAGNFGAGMANESNSLFNVVVNPDVQLFENSTGFPQERQAFAACEQQAFNINGNVGNVASCFNALRRQAAGIAETPSMP